MSAFHRAVRATLRSPRAKVNTAAPLSLAVPLARGLLAPAYTSHVPLPSHHGPQFDVVIVGAGFAMFGSPEGPWNMSARAEVKLGPRLKVHAVIDPDMTRANAALSLKRASYVKDSYADTVVLPDLALYAARVAAGEAREPKAIFVASPPQYRGGLGETNNLELQINKFFPNASVILEKPVSTGVPWEQSVAEAKEVGRVLETKHKGIVSVAYCLRYLRAVQEMKRIIEENNLTVMATIARYVMAYELAVKTEWWTKSVCQGPIIENGTHICDLARYFGGDVDLDSLVAHAIEYDEKPGELSKKNFDESVIPAHDRIPRATSASWKYESGAVGNLLHATALHGVDYAIELEVYADGYQMILQDPYGTPSLALRRPGSDTLEVIPTPGDDPYTTEMSNFIDAIEGGPDPRILSSYEDAAKTYELTWSIRNAGEASTRARRAKKAM